MLYIKLTIPGDQYASFLGSHTPTTKAVNTHAIGNFSHGTSLWIHTYALAHSEGPAEL